MNVYQNAFRVDAAVVAPNRIELKADNVAMLRLYLNDRLVDLKKPVTVTVNKKVKFEGRLKPSVGGNAGRPGLPGTRLALLLRDDRSRPRRDAGDETGNSPGNTRGARQAPTRSATRCGSVGTSTVSDSDFSERHPERAKRGKQLPGGGV